jgi:hypothetical protein
LLKKAQEDNMLKGLSFGIGGPHITHLLFADDFLEATVESLHTLRGILQRYEVASGQKVNLQKSSIFLVMAVAQKEKWSRSKPLVSLKKL